MLISRRRATQAGLLVLAGGSPALTVFAGDLPPVKVYKSPTCGCCQKWVTHMENAGFALEVIDLQDVQPVKKGYGVPPRLGSCHTAIVDGYVVEGHVPADDVLRLLRERPDVAGLAVPGMPAGSPGMEAPVSQPYDVVAFQRDGSSRVFSSYAR